MIKKALRWIALILAVCLLSVGIAVVRPQVLPRFRDRQISTDSAGDGHTKSSQPDFSQLSPELQSLLDEDAYYPPELLETLASNPETIDYVKNYPALHDQEQEIDLSQEVQSGTVPLLLQWDTRWGYLSYGDGLIGYTGCGPTCLSMTSLYLTGNAEYTPKAVAEYADMNGYYADGVGTSWTLFSQGCEAFGLSAEELPLDEGRMSSALALGHPIICALGPGDFTTTGHFIVLTGYQDGMFTLNDPNSVERSSKEWSYDTLSKQIRNLWAMSST